MSAQEIYDFAHKILNSDDSWKAVAELMLAAESEVVHVEEKKRTGPKSLKKTLTDERARNLYNEYQKGGVSIRQLAAKHTNMSGEGLAYRFRKFEKKKPRPKKESSNKDDLNISLELRRELERQIQNRINDKEIDQWISKHDVITKVMNRFPDQNLKQEGMDSTIRKIFKGIELLSPEDYVVKRGGIRVEKFWGEAPTLDEMKDGVNKYVRNYTKRGRK